jgi:hypothetical protein
MNTTGLKKVLVPALSTLLILGCETAGTGSGSADMNSALGIAPLVDYAPKPSNFRVSLTDAPAKELTSVFVNLHSIELWIRQGEHRGRLILTRNSGMIDLMTLRNGVLLDIQDITMPTGISIEEIRLVLNPDNNHAIKKDGSTCELQTPSGQQSGVKIKLQSTVTVEDGYSYSMVVDFDAEKSVVIKGNGDCLLKPVIKIAGMTRTPLENIDDDGEPVGEPVDEPAGNDGGGDDGSGVDDGTGDDSTGDDETDDDGFDISDPGTWPPGYEPVFPTGPFDL